jgi:hypothetical protein
MFIGLSGSLKGQEIVRYNLFGQPGTQLSNAPEFTASNITGDILLQRSPGGIVPSTGVNSMASNTWAVGQYYSFGFTVNAGYQVDLTNLQIGTRSSSTGPKFLVLYSSVDGFTTPLATITHPSVVAFVNSDINLSSLTGLTGSVEFRLRVDENKKALDETPIAATGTNRVTNFFAPSGDPPANTDTGGFRINGTVSPVGGGATVVGSFAYHTAYPGTSNDKVDASKQLFKQSTGLAVPLEMNHLINSKQGITGVGFDVDGLANGAGLSASDFVFKMSPQNVFDGDLVSGWVDAPAPTAITVNAGSPDRIIIEWPDNSIENRWLKVTMKATANTGLAEDCVFYLGHLRGEGTGPSAGKFTVLVADILNVRSNLTASQPASGMADIDKSGTVLVADILETRSNLAKELTQIQVPGSPPES